MTTVDILFRYVAEPDEAVAFALGNMREVYGIRQLRIDKPAHAVLVEYDATRLNAATVTNLVRSAGLQIAEELPLLPPQPEPEVTATA